MKEIYIVTTGCYSDYGIEEVFSNKNKAEEYARLMNKGQTDNGYGYRVETYEVDNIDIKSVEFVEVKAKKYLSNKDQYEFEMKIYDAIYSSDRATYINVADYGSDKYSFITIKRPVNNRDKNKLENIYRKVVQDYFFMIESNWDFYVEYKNRHSLEDRLSEEIN